MNKQSIYFLLAIACLLPLSSCTAGRSQAINAGDENFRTGTQGLQLRFLPYSPPDKIFDNEELHARIEVFNKGAEDITGSNNRLYLSGFDTTIITGIPTMGFQIPDLQGKKFFNPEGEFDNVDITGFVRDLKSRNIDFYNTILMATACYKYKTIADPSACVDPDPFSTSVQDKVCDFNSQPALGSQGAPVIIDSVQVEAMNGKARFKISARNAGGGDVLKDGADILDRCNPYDPKGLDIRDLDYVHVDEVVLGDTSILGNCRPLENGYLRLRTSGSGAMICEVDGLSGPAYLTPLRITVSYNYRSIITQNLRILQAN
ncbi:MAG: hypothetical protein V1837_01055 [Candidatus Woesearchaeota archaeon]